MANKCTNCGYNCGEYDIFCSQCGMKLEQNSSQETINTDILDDSLNKFSIFENIKKNISENKQFTSFNSNAVNFFENNILHFVGILLIIAFALVTVLYFVLNSQGNHRIELQYKNLINNPQQIPELKEPANLVEFVDNLDKNHKFMSLYLNHSDDSVEKKEQIFASFINEIEKLPHLSNENLIKDEKDKCFKITSNSQAKTCSSIANKQLKDIGVVSYPYGNSYYLFADYEFIYDKYASHLSNEFQRYLKYKAKYTKPIAIGIELYAKPKEMANFIFDTEQLYLVTTNSIIKEILEKTMQESLKKFIFTSSIYATTTQEMKPEFKKGYEYYIKTKKDSQFAPLFMSYLDKKRAYSETNFANDYPYKMHEKTFEENVRNSSLSDIYAQLRKNIFSQNTQYSFDYVYNFQGGVWEKYKKDSKIEQNQYVMSGQDENGNVSIYTNTFSRLQELNIPKYSKLYLLMNNLFVYNSDKLTVSKIAFNGRNFFIQGHSSSDIASLFPGINIINIDSYSNYNIQLTKENSMENFIILSRYSSGYNDYVISSLGGKISSIGLPNMFSVDTEQKTVVSFHHKNIQPDGMSENSPTYRFVILTRGEYDEQKEQEYAEYDEKTADDEKEVNDHKPSIMPKIIKEEIEIVEVEKIDEAPTQEIKPPKDDEN